MRIVDSILGRFRLYRRLRGGLWEYQVRGAMEYMYTTWVRVEALTGAFNKYGYYGGRKPRRCEDYTTRKSLSPAPSDDELHALSERETELAQWAKGLKSFVYNGDACGYRPAGGALPRVGSEYFTVLCAGVGMPLTDEEQAVVARFEELEAWNANEGERGDGRPEPSAAACWLTFERGGKRPDTADRFLTLVWWHLGEVWGSDWSRRPIAFRAAQGFAPAPVSGSRRS